MTTDYAAIPAGVPYRTADGRTVVRLSLRNPHRTVPLCVTAAHVLGKPTAHIIAHKAGAWTVWA